MPPGDRRTVCLFCRFGLDARRPLTHRRRPLLQQRRSSTSSNADQATATANSTPLQADSQSSVASSRSEKPISQADLERQLDLYSPSEIYRRIFIGPEKVQQSSNVSTKLYNKTLGKDDANPLSDSTGGQRAPPSTADSAHATMKQLLLAQLYVCGRVDELSRVFAVAMRSPNRAVQRLLYSDPDIKRALLHKLRERSRPDLTLQFLNRYISRGLAASFSVDTTFVSLALLHAAASHELGAVRHYLQQKLALLRRPGADADNGKVFGAVFITALHYGYLSAPPSSKPARRLAMLELLYGSDSSPAHLRPHLRTFAPASLRAWTRLLAALNAPAELWREWEDRNAPPPGHAAAFAKTKMRFAFRAERQEAFISALLALGGEHAHAESVERAWQIVRKTGRRGYKVPLRLGESEELLARLCRSLEMRPRGDVPPAVREALGAALAERLERHVVLLEKALGVRWVQPAGAGAGPEQAPYHDLEPEFYRRLKAIGRSGYRADQDQIFWRTSATASATEVKDLVDPPARLKPTARTAAPGIRLADQSEASEETGKALGEVAEELVDEQEDVLLGLGHEPKPSRQKRQQESTHYLDEA